MRLFLLYRLHLNCKVCCALYGTVFTNLLCVWIVVCCVSCADDIELANYMCSQLMNEVVFTLQTAFEL